MKLWNIVLFFLCFNAAGYIIANLVALDVLMGDRTVTSDAMVDIKSRFDLGAKFNMQNIIGGILGIVAIGAIGMFTGQGMMAVIGAIIWVIAMFIGIFDWITNGFGNMIAILLAGTGLEFMGVVVGTIVTVYFFFVLASMLSQRQDLT